MLLDSDTYHFLGSAVRHLSIVCLYSFFLGPDVTYLLC